MIKEFQGKVAVITGAGSGIGRSLAFAFAKKGMKLVISDINESTINKVKQELEKNGSEVISLVADVSKKDQVMKLADSTYDRFGKAHILSNNAGFGTIGSMHQLTLKDWELVLGVKIHSSNLKIFLNRRRI